jgi:hypothetical protein
MTSTQGHPPPHGRFVADAVRSANGLKLHIEGEGLAGGGAVTHVDRLEDAEDQVRRHLGDLYEVDFSDAVVEIVSY